MQKQLLSSLYFTPSSCIQVNININKPFARGELHNNPNGMILKEDPLTNTSAISEKNAAQSQTSGKRFIAKCFLS